MIMGEEVPSVAVVAVILTHRPPLPFAQIRPPLLPVDLLFPRLFEACFFGVHEVLVSSDGKNRRGRPPRLRRRGAVMRHRRRCGVELGRSPRRWRSAPPPR